jgi:hypothetical protein
MHVLAGRTPGAHHAMNDETEPAKCGKSKDVARHTNGWTPLQAIERFSEAGAEGSRDTYLPSVEHPPEEQHGKEVQKTEWNLRIDTPVDECDYDYKEARSEKD